MPDEDFEEIAEQLGNVRSHESDSSLIEQRQFRGKINFKKKNGWLLFPALFGTYALMFLENHALPVQASIMLRKFPDTVEQTMTMFLSWQRLLQRTIKKKFFAPVVKINAIS